MQKSSAENDLRADITQLIVDYAREHNDNEPIAHTWRTPIVRFGDANHPDMARLRELVHPEHVLPCEVLPNAKTLIAYFFPFSEEIGNTNRRERLASHEWAVAYEKTNAAFKELNGEIIAFCNEHGVDAAVPPEAGSYDETILKSRWSQRHLAYLCGMGTFGVNNMLITDAGGCGRYATVVTNMDVPHDGPLAEERCLYKRSGACGACVKRCPSHALTLDGYDRRICNSLCDENAAVHVGLGSSYVLEDTGGAIVGTNVCGKCVVGVPCTYKIP